MDHRGLRERLAGAGCTACGAVIPTDRIAVLADRRGLAFVELTCESCGNRAMCVVLPAGSEPSASVEGTPALPGQPMITGAGTAAPPVLSETDVREMRRFLATWDGDLRSLLDHQGGSTGSGTAR
jgi:hypothetical protein